jgi:transcriptional regulator GlxA family with amidase domain
MGRNGMRLRGDYSALRPGKEAPSVDAPLRIGIAPTPDFTLMSLSCFVEFLRLAADEGDYSRRIYCTWELLSHDTAPIRASCGFPMVPTKMFSDPRDYDFVVVHGGILHSTAPVPDALYRFVQACVKARVPVVGLCTGPFVLAELGYLDGKRCAVHFSLAPTMQQNFPKVIAVTDAAVVSDGGFITCPGGLAAINLAAHLVSSHCGEVRSHKALHYLMADRGFDAIQAMKQNPEIGLHCPDRRVVNAVGLMRQKAYEAGSIAEVARSTGTSERELNRLFKMHLGVAPLQYWRRMRLSTAKWMLLNSSRSVAQIAYECGFSDSSHLIHWFQREYQTSPTKLRRQQATLGVH